MNMQLITNDMLVEKYGDMHNGIQVFSKGRPVGYLSDLRMAYSKDQSKRKKQKEYNNKVTEARRDAMPDAVNEALDYFKSHFSKYDCEVFINISQPNIHINECKCYIIIDPIYGLHRLGIHNPNKSADDMASEVGMNFKISNSNSPHHILINGLDYDAIVETITQLCLK